MGEIRLDQSRNLAFEINPDIIPEYKSMITNVSDIERKMEQMVRNYSKNERRKIWSRHHRNNCKSRSRW